MKSERDCEESAQFALQEYVNGCKCATPQDASRAIQKMIAVSMHALELVETGKQEIVQ